jgi:hypothetical protein
MPSGGAFRAVANSTRAILTTRLTAPLADLALVGDQGCDDEISLHQVLDLATGTTLASFQVTGWPQVWDRPGERLVAACRTSEGTRFQVVDANGTEVASLAVGPSDYDGGGFQISDGAGRIAFQPREGRGPALVVWSLEEGTSLLEIRGGRGMVLSGDGRSVFVFEGWDVDVFLRDGRHFFYDHRGGWPYILRLEVPSGAPSWLQTRGVAHNVRIPTFIVESPSAMLAMGPQASLWNLVSETGFVPASEPTVDSAAFSPDGALVVFSRESGSETILYVFTADGRDRATLEVEGARGEGVGFCLDGRAIWVGSSETVFLGLPGQ